MAASLVRDLVSQIERSDLINDIESNRSMNIYGRAISDIYVGNEWNSENNIRSAKWSGNMSASGRRSYGLISLIWHIRFVRVQPDGSKLKDKIELEEMILYEQYRSNVPQIRLLSRTRSIFYLDKNHRCG